MQKSHSARRNDSAYVIVEGPTWHEAEATAQKLGGHLAAINSEEENKWLKDNINWRKPDSLNMGHGNRVIGYWRNNDEKTEGKYQWSSGEVFNYSAINWDRYPTQNEDYITIGSNGEWNDINSGIAGTTASNGYTWWQMKYGIAEIKLGSEFGVQTSASLKVNAVNDAPELTGQKPSLIQVMKTSATQSRNRIFSKAGAM